MERLNQHGASEAISTRIALIRKGLNSQKKRLGRTKRQKQLSRMLFIRDPPKTQGQRKFASQGWKKIR